MAKKRRSKKKQYAGKVRDITADSIISDCHEDPTEIGGDEDEISEDLNFDTVVDAGLEDDTGVERFDPRSCW